MFLARIGRMRRDRNPAAQHKRLIYRPSARNRTESDSIYDVEKSKEKMRILPHDCAMRDEENSKTNDQSRLPLRRRSRGRRRRRIRVLLVHASFDLDRPQLFVRTKELKKQQLTLPAGDRRRGRGKKERIV